MPLKMFTRDDSLKMYEIRSARISWLKEKILKTKHPKTKRHLWGLPCLLYSKQEVAS